MSVEPRVILVVDDESFNCELVARTLREHTVVSTQDAKEALEKFDSIAPAIVLTDYRMPSVTGIEFIRSLRSRGFLLPVLLVTAFPDLEDVVRGKRELGFTIITKPWKPDEFRRHVEHALKLSKLQAQVRELKHTIR